MELEPGANASAQCQNCSVSLCIRQQTINLALGNQEIMFCLLCLGEQLNCGALEVMENTKGYISSRQCFRKEWAKYTCRADCPQPLSCLPEVCFAD